VLVSPTGLQLWGWFVFGHQLQCTLKDRSRHAEDKKILYVRSDTVYFLFVGWVYQERCLSTDSVTSGAVRTEFSSCLISVSLAVHCGSRGQDKALQERAAGFRMSESVGLRQALR
jgi:hypothetical protein